MLRHGTLRSTTWSPGRRRALAGASAAVVCLGAALGACAGSGGGGGYVAVGGAGRSGPVDASPTGSVTMVPLDGPKGGGTTSPGTAGSPSGATVSGPGPARAGNGPVPSSPDRPSPTGTSTGAGASPGGGSGTGDARTTPAPAPPDPTPAPTAPPAPAALSWGEPVTADGDQRWCQKVTVDFRNSGGTAVRSGSVTFGTHVIGALGIDWSTVRTPEALPVPIGAGARTDHTWTVCLDAWRVPLGMHIETRDLSVQWK
ncbi:hypothetical protein CQW39_08355 [Streptomyces griseofuscus]|uniref:hypothetical protein n=1 Tax=Streptomyces griseofuscus TaxID=146922 RepID=UPI000F6546D0|nr:hypothetical protein [Streptomyces griseofuscus]RRQ80462.1 hypothetical protein CQW39_08355 [Streptomyces griseofuscus]